MNHEYLECLEFLVWGTSNSPYEAVTFPAKPQDHKEILCQQPKANS